MELIREIRNIDSDKIIIEVPKDFRKRRVEILVLPLEESEEETCVEESKNENFTASGLCGIWEDERDAEEIIDDIYSHRTGFGNRKVTL